MGPARRTRSTGYAASSSTAAPTPRRRPGPALKLARARTELDTLTRTAGTRYHPTVAAVTTKAAEIARRRVGAYLRPHITTTPEGKPTFAWSFDQAAIDAAEVLCRYKDQPVVERRYGDLKGPWPSH